MRVNQFLLSISMALILTGCASTSIPVKPIDVPSYQPDPPSQVILHDVPWKVIVQNNQPFVGLSYQDYLTYLEDKESILNYINQSNLIICYYRKQTTKGADKSASSNDPFCQTK